MAKDRVEVRLTRTEVEIGLLKRELDRKLAQRADLRRALAAMPSTDGSAHRKRRESLSARIKELGRGIEHLREEIAGRETST